MSLTTEELGDRQQKGAFILWTLSLALFFATWWAFRSKIWLLNGDGVVPIFVSLQRWTPFYWGQSRFGMLLPLLATPLRHPLANLLFQSFLTALCAVWATLLLPVYLGLKREAILTGLLGLVAFSTILKDQLLYDFCSLSQPYASALFLFLVGSIACNRGWFLFGSLLLTLGLWEDYALFPVELLLVVGMWLWKRRKRDAITALILFLAFGANFLLVHHYWDGNKSVSQIACPTHWIGNARHLLKSLWGFVNSLFLIGLAGFFLWLERYRRDLFVPIALCMTTSVGSLLLASSLWVEMNFWNPRYLIPTLFLGLIGMVLPLACWLEEKGPKRLPFLVFAFLVAIMAARFGLPSLSGMKETLKLQSPIDAERAAALPVQIVAGTYDRAWLSSFFIAWARADTGNPLPIYALSDRSASTACFWQPIFVPGVSFLRFSDEHAFEDQKEWRLLNQKRGNYMLTKIFEAQKTNTEKKR